LQLPAHGQFDLAQPQAIKASYGGVDHGQHSPRGLKRFVVATETLQGESGDAKRPAFGKVVEISSIDTYGNVHVAFRWWRNAITIPICEVQP
jgi:hypothetical protein